MTTRLCFFLLLLFSPMVTHAQTPPLPPPVNHDFDFWIGEWEVFGPDGGKAGENRIEPVSGGRALLENWTGADGTTGKSMNAFVPYKNQWQQFWVGEQGGVLELSGGLADGKMVLSSIERKLRDGRMLTNRVSWTPHADGTVRQHWELSFDSGKTWQTVFDGTYRRKAGNR